MDPLTSQIPPAPASPPPVTGMPETPGGLSQDQMRANLSEMKTKLDSKYQPIQDQMATNKTAEQTHNSDILKQLFDLLIQRKIDPNDPAAVGEFLNKLKTESPEIYQQVVDALNSILGPEASVEGMASPGGGDIATNPLANPLANPAAQAPEAPTQPEAPMGEEIPRG